jgi:hypothetical protein
MRGLISDMKGPEHQGLDLQRAAALILTLYKIWEKMLKYAKFVKIR